MDRRLLFIALSVTILALPLALLTLPPSPKHSPDRLQIGVLPDESEESLRKRHAPLLTYLSDQTDRQVELVIPKNYGHLLKLFGQGKVDLAYFGGLTFVQAEAWYGAEPLVLRDLDARFSSLFIAHKDTPENSLEEFRGASLSFGSKLSTSGHLMPRHFIQTELNSTPEDFFSSLSFSGSHDRTAYNVRDGEVKLGVANREIIEKMLQDGRLSRNNIKIIWQTPPYSDYVWSVQKSMETELKNKLRDAFLKLSKHNPTDATILERTGANIFLPANRSDYKQLRHIAAQRGLLE